MKNIKSILKINDLVKIVIIFLIVIILLLFIPNLDNSFVLSDKLYITEIMANNTYTHMDDFGEYSDYIELYNGYKYPVNLEGFYLSDSEYETDKWKFPDINIDAGEYLIIYASGKDRCDLGTKICHTNFKLSSNGETIILTDKSNNIINKFTYGMMSNDLAYGYVSKRYMLLDDASPLGENNTKSLKYQKISNKDIYISEYMIYNQRYSYDQMGNYNDFMELYNGSRKDINLRNIYLSDSDEDLTKYKLPNITLKKDSYLLIYLGDESKIVNNQIIASFKLSEKDNYIIVSNGKKVIDKVEVVEMVDNVSYGRKDNKWYYFTKPTPGTVNSTKALSSLGGL